MDKMDNGQIIYLSNMHYLNPSSVDMPKRYIDGKIHKDDDGEQYVMIDRLYGGLFETSTRLIQVDGSTYKGHIKRFKINSRRYSVTEDGRWFNESGMPVNCPEGYEHKVSEVKSESNKIQDDKKYQELKNKVLGKKGWYVWFV